MDVRGALPTLPDMAVVLAARSAMAQMSAKTAGQVSAQADNTAQATRSASTVSGGSVDMYL